MFRLLKKAAIEVPFVPLSIVLMVLFSGCSSSSKTMIMAYPNYFEINSGQEVPVAMGGDNIQKKIPSDMFCYDAQAQADVLSAKKGSK